MTREQEIRERLGQAHVYPEFLSDAVIARIATADADIRYLLERLEAAQAIVDAAQAIVDADFMPTFEQMLTLRATLQGILSPSKRALPMEDLIACRDELAALQGGKRLSEELFALASLDELKEWASHLELHAEQAATLEAKVERLREALREEYLISPMNETICVRCGASWSMGSPHEYHEGGCLLAALQGGE